MTTGAQNFNNCCKARHGLAKSRGKCNALLAVNAENASVEKEGFENLNKKPPGSFHNGQTYALAAQLSIIRKYNYDEAYAYWLSSSKRSCYNVDS